MSWMSINQWKKKCKIGVKPAPAPAQAPKLKLKPKSKPKGHGNGRDNSKDQEPDPPFKLLGFDTFSSEWYTLGSFATEGKAIAAGHAKLRVIEHLQPSVTSGGQAERGIQDRVFIERPDGTKVRVLPQVPISKRRSI